MCTDNLHKCSNGPDDNVRVCLPNMDDSMCYLSSWWGPELSPSLNAVGLFAIVMAEDSILNQNNICHCCFASECRLIYCFIIYTHTDELQFDAFTNRSNFIPIIEKREIVPSFYFLRHFILIIWIYCIYLYFFLVFHFTSSQLKCR